MTELGAEPAGRRPSRLTLLWRKHRARWMLPIVIIVIIGVVAVVDHLGSHRISQVDAPSSSVLVAAKGGTSTVELDQPWSGFNPNTPSGAASSTPTLLTSVLPSAYVIDPKLVPEVNNDLLLSVEATSTSPLTIQYVINPAAVWSDGVPVSADDFIYAWQSQRGTGVDVDGSPDQVASTLGYRDVASVTSSHEGKTVTVVFTKPYTDWRVMFDHMVPAHIARQVGWNHGFDSFDPRVDLSAGPMILQSVSPTGRAVLVPNPKWWGTPAVLHRVVVSVAPTISSWAASLAHGSRSVAQPTKFDLATLEAVSSMPNTQSTIEPSLSLLELVFNVDSPVAVKPARQAVAHAIDRQQLLAHTLGSMDPGLVVNEDHLATASQPTYTPSSASGEYSTVDPTTTDRLLKSIGYHRDASGDYADASGRPLTMRMAVEEGDPWISEVGDQISAQLHDMGISVETVPVDGTAGMARAAADNSYDMALVTRRSSPFESVTGAWYSDTDGPPGSAGWQNWSMLEDPQVDELFSQAARALNPTTGDAIYNQIDDQLWDQMVSLPLFEEPGLLANDVQIGNVEYNPSVDGILWNVSLWTALSPPPADQRT